MKNEPIQDEYEPRTMSSIIYEKYLDQLERSSLDRILDVSGRIAVGVTLSTAMVLGDQLAAVLASNNFAIPKVAGCLLFGWYKRPIFGAVTYISQRVMETLEKEKMFNLGKLPEIEAPTPILVGGVEIEKLAETILLRKGWNRADAESLGIGRTESEKIGKGLEKIGALVRGPKNSKVLFDGYTLEDLRTVFTNYATSWEFTSTPILSLEEGTWFSISPLKTGE